MKINTANMFELHVAVTRRLEAIAPPMTMIMGVYVEPNADTGNVNVTVRIRNRIDSSGGTVQIPVKPEELTGTIEQVAEYVVAAVRRCMAVS